MKSLLKTNAKWLAYGREVSVLILGIVIGFFIGGFLGVSFMAILNMSRDDDK